MQLFLQLNLLQKLLSKLLARLSRQTRYLPAVTIFTS